MPLPAQEHVPPRLFLLEASRTGHHSPDPPSSAAGTLCSRQPQLGLLSFVTSLTFTRSSLLPGYSSSLASSHHSLLETQLLHVDAPLPPPPQSFKSCLFPSFTPLLVGQLTVSVCLKTRPVSSEFCASLYTQVCRSAVPTLCSPVDLQPTWLPYPWGIRGFSSGDSPGKNTGVGCCSILQGIFPTQTLERGSPAFFTVRAGREALKQTMKGCRSESGTRPGGAPQPGGGQWGERAFNGHRRLTTTHGSLKPHFPTSNSSV